MVVSDLTGRRSLDRRESRQQGLRVKDEEDDSTEREHELGQDPVVTKQAPWRAERLDEAVANAAMLNGRIASRQIRSVPTYAALTTLAFSLVSPVAARTRTLEAAPNQPIETTMCAVRASFRSQGVMGVISALNEQSLSIHYVYLNTLCIQPGHCVYLRRAEALEPDDRGAPA
jgi:hypothetical protein